MYAAKHPTQRGCKNSADVEAGVEGNGEGIGWVLGALRSLCTYPGGGKGKREKERIFPKSDGSNGDEIGQNFGNRKESLERI